MKLELLKQTKIDINIYDFTDKLLKLYYSKIPADGNTFNDEINNVVKEITGYDLYDCDNTYEVMEDILNRAQSLLKEDDINIEELLKDCDDE